MKVKCDFCDRTATVTKDQLIDMGWKWAVVHHRIITACPDHLKEFNTEFLEAVKQ